MCIFIDQYYGLGWLYILVIFRTIDKSLWVYLLGFYTTYAIYFQVWWNHVSSRDLSTSVKAVCAWRMPNTLEISLFTAFKLLYSCFAMWIFNNVANFRLHSSYFTKQSVYHSDHVIWRIHTAYAIYWYQVTWLITIIKITRLVGLFIPWLYVWFVRLTT